MRESLFRCIPACSPHDLRWDFRDVLAGDSPVPRPTWADGVLAAASMDHPDALWGSEDAGRKQTTGGDGDPSIRGLVLAAHSAVAEVERETPSRDAFASNLRHLLRGGALAGDHHLFLAFDDRRRPAIGWMGRWDSTRLLLERLALLARQSIPVLVHGETGTGKEIVARGIHGLGTRRDRPFLAVNCAELAQSVLESELFGHARGAFTGASEDRAGLFETAEEGSVFLDEIGELPLVAQAKLLRVLEEHRVRRIGASSSRPLGCRVIAATNRDLAREVAEGRFRSDLFYRLRGSEILLPPLRQRRSEILPLAEGFVARAAVRARRDTHLAPDGRLALLAHDWPGNVRELRQTIDLAVLSAPGGPVTAAQLALAGPDASGTSAAEPWLTVRAVERTHILRALSSTAGNKMAAARLLGLSRQSLQRRMLRHGILAAAERVTRVRAGDSPAANTLHRDGGCSR